MINKTIAFTVTELTLFLYTVPFKNKIVQIKLILNVRIVFSTFQEQGFLKSKDDVQSCSNCKCIKLISHTINMGKSYCKEEKCQTAAKCLYIEKE